jgi:outer membrane protein assembly factor BamB
VRRADTILRLLIRDRYQATAATAGDQHSHKPLVAPTTTAERMPPTRRSLLRASAVAGTAGLAGCLGDSPLADSPLADPIPPAPDTWPLANYDPQQTAANRDAGPPTDPAVETFDSTGDASTVVVGGQGDERRVVVGGYDRLTAHRPDGSVAWRAGDADEVAIRPGSDVCYATGGNAPFRALSLADGSRQWTTEAPNGFTVVPSTHGPFLPFNGGIDAYDREGTHRYRVARGDGLGHAGVALADTVYVTDVGMAERLRPRGTIREFRERPPAAEWRVERSLGYCRTVAVADGTVFLTDERTDGTGGVLALDAATGGVQWRRDLGQRPDGLAVGPERLFLAMSIDRETEENLLFALRRDDGTTDWQAAEYGPDSGYYADPVVAGDSVLVGGKQVDRRAGFLQSFTLAGDEQWTVEFETAVRAVAPVEGRLYVATDEGRLAILS